MRYTGIDISYEESRKIIMQLSDCMNDYLFAYDVQTDRYFISPEAVKRFRISSNEIIGLNNSLRDIVHEDDYDALVADLNNTIDGVQAVHNMQYRWLDKQGNSVWVNCRGRVVRNTNGSARLLLGCLNEIGDRGWADNTSGLLGSFVLSQNFANSMAQGKTGYIIRLGIDGLKVINENHGNEYGDMIIRKTAECIESVMEEGERVFRLVADEYVVLDFSGNGVEHALDIYHRVSEAVNDFITKIDYEVFYTMSAGVVATDDMGDKTFESLMKCSEFALNEAKNRGRNQAYVFENKEYERFKNVRHTVDIIRKAVNNNFEGFRAYFQPIVDIDQNTFVGAETLLRFCDPDGNMISPADMIPILEETGLIIPVGRWVMHEAMKVCKLMQDYIPGFHITINVSYVQVLRSNMLGDLIECKEAYGLPDNSMVVELTESGFIESDESFIKFCEGLRENGIRLALDDFGTGYSNFHYLYNLRPDTLKIDRTFAMKALLNEYELLLLKHMSDMVHSIGLKMVIEGIETQDQLEGISRVKPDYIQGFYFGKPMSKEAFIETVTGVH